MRVQILPNRAYGSPQCHPTLKPLTFLGRTAASDASSPSQYSPVAPPSGKKTTRLAALLALFLTYGAYGYSERQQALNTIQGCEMQPDTCTALQVAQAQKQASTNLIDMAFAGIGVVSGAVWLVKSLRGND